MTREKTHKAAAKRLKITANGKVLRKKGGKNHLNTKKSQNRKRHLRKKAVHDGEKAKKWKKLLRAL